MIVDDLFESPQTCPECGGPAFSDLLLAEKKDACYHKVRSRYKVWPSAYASGALVQCRKKGAANWGNKSEGVAEGWKEKVGAAALAGAVATGANANTPKVPLDQAIRDATAWYNINKAVKKQKEKSKEETPKKTDKEVKEQGVAEGSYAVDADDDINDYYAGYYTDLLGEIENMSFTDKVETKLGIKRSLENGELRLVDLKSEINALDREISKTKRGVSEGAGDKFEQAHHSEVEKYIATHGTPGEYRHKYDAMGRAHNSYLTYPGRTVTINTQQYGDRFGHNVFTKKEGVAEASPEATFNTLKGLKTWQVVIMNNYYRGKYPDYSGRYYYVLASSPEEAEQVVLDNADAILQELLAMKSVNGRKILPRSSALRITADRIGEIRDGTEAGRMSTAGFKKMFGPQGPMMVKLANGAIADVQGQEKVVAEDDAGDVEQRMIAKIEKEKQRLAKLKQIDPEAYKREMAKRKTSSRVPPVSTFEEQLDEKCWDTHRQVGMKKKGDRMVPNCVPKEGVNESEREFRGANGPVSVTTTPGRTVVKRKEWDDPKTGSLGNDGKFHDPDFAYFKSARKSDYDSGDYSNDRDLGEGNKVGNMDADRFDDAMSRLKQLAGQGPRKTVWDPVKRVYKTVPVNPPQSK